VQIPKTRSSGSARKGYDWSDRYPAIAVTAMKAPACSVIVLFRRTPSDLHSKWGAVSIKKRS
jgi:hypothetical protein